MRRERAGPQGEQEGKQWETVLRGKSEHGYMGLDCQAGRWAQENLAVGEGKWCPEQKAVDAQRVTEGARHQPYLPSVFSRPCANKGSLMKMSQGHWEKVLKAFKSCSHINKHHWIYCF